MIQVDPGEAQTAQAFTDSEQGNRLRIGCSQTSAWVNLSIGAEPVFGSRLDLTAAFDSEPEMKLGVATYAGGSYNITLQPPLLSKITSRETVSIFADSADFADTFSLNGAREAIEAMRCLGETP
jgi:hypothetical protein